MISEAARKSVDPALARERVEKSISVLCDEQTRLMLMQSAATLSRLAAAISHEMNNPLGALISAVDSLQEVCARRSAATDNVRLQALEQDLVRTIKDSTGRLRDVVTRMQRFTNLNRAEIQHVDVNSLITDVIGLLHPDIRKIVSTGLESIPPVLAHPQQLSAVFNVLLHNAIDSLGPGGSVSIRTRTTPGMVHCEIIDTGRGISAEALSEIFEPGFRSDGGRVAASNWNLFSCRHIIESHGGQIHISSEPGKGTTVHVALPSISDSQDAR